MPKKAKPTKKTPKAKKKPLPQIPICREEYLEILIRASERAISNQGTSIDAFFTEQADRLKKELAQLKGKK